MQLEERRQIDPSDQRALDRDVRGLAALEAAHHAIALSALVGMAIHGVIASDDVATKGALAVAIGLALLHLALALRVRLGAELLRRELRVSHAVDVGRAHPYRTPAPRPRPASVDHDASPAALIRCISIAIVAATAAFAIRCVLFP